MRRIRLSELDDAVQRFLTEAFSGEGILVEDEQGRPQGGFFPYRRATAEQKQRAEQHLEEIRQKVGASMQAQAITEQDVIREILADDTN